MNSKALALNGVGLRLPLFSDPIAAGFAGTASDMVEQTLDLNEHLVKHPAATYFVKVVGNSMEGAGIKSGDILVVDRSKSARNGAVVIASVNGEFTVKRLKKSRKGAYLVAENKKYNPIHVKKDDDFEVWGVVTSAIHSLG